MQFPFFTLGGSQFWEDVFYYQKWRIQRHYSSRKYRLLDNWDIQRASGSFEQCRAAFVKCVEVYEIPRQKGDLVILLHGLGESKSVFHNLWKALSEKGYNVAALNYPSTRKALSYHIRQLEFFLTHCEDINKVSFITKGESCLLLRLLVSNTYGWQNHIAVDKVININPINAGSDWLDYLSRFGLFRFLLGPMLNDAAPSRARTISKLPATTDVGLIFCKTWVDKLCEPIVRRFQGLPIKSEIKETSFSDKRIHIENKRFNILSNAEVIAACQKFLENGSFE
jgi:hypothetical protein